jgi:hypothetical protein
MTETIPVYIKGTDNVLQSEPASDNQVIQTDTEPGTPPKTLPKGNAKASARRIPPPVRSMGRPVKNTCLHPAIAVHKFTGAA